MLTQARVGNLEIYSRLRRPVAAVFFHRDHGMIGTVEIEFFGEPSTSLSE